jgi:hypothetical protein
MLPQPVLPVLPITVPMNEGPFEGTYSNQQKG